MNRRNLLKAFAAPLVPLTSAPLNALAQLTNAARSLSRVRPGDAAWPSEGAWDQLNRDVGDQLIKLQSPFALCMQDPQGGACADIFRLLKNPYAVGDDVALTENLGWVDA